MTFSEYIQNLIATKYRGQPTRMLGKCELEAKTMAELFPELAVVPGHVTIVVDGEPRRRAHWWCTDGVNIVDPTERQFGWPIEKYEPYQDGDPIRLGKCMNCGQDIWGHPDRGRQDICSTKCRRELAAYLNGEKLK